MASISNRKKNTAVFIGFFEQDRKISLFCKKLQKNDRLLR
ncbi:hypothetical protein HMPREF1128_1353 [Haemophilus sputorum HK 2154]|nr:hypothetical protein HMPREF1128_1353 [Haemophilus sputorum HK 2154]